MLMNMQWRRRRQQLIEQLDNVRLKLVAAECNAEILFKENERLRTEMVKMAVRGLQRMVVSGQMSSMLSQAPSTESQPRKPSSWPIQLRPAQSAHDPSSGLREWLRSLDLSELLEAVLAPSGSNATVQQLLGVTHAQLRQRLEAAGLSGLADAVWQKVCVAREQIPPPDKVTSAQAVAALARMSGAAAQSAVSPATA